MREPDYISDDGTVTLYRGDCLEIMPGLLDASVDMVMADPPYGTTACKWDSVIPLEPMWAQLKRLIKPRGAIVMTASQPFTTALISSNMRMFKYCWVWDKKRPSGFQIAKYRPMMRSEDVCIFGAGRIKYYPEMVLRNSPVTDCARSKSGSSPLKYLDGIKRTYTHKFPQSIIEIPKPSRAIHSTQKPVALMEYLIKTYTHAGETVLDFTMGSGTTGVACMNLNRRFIGIELDAGYFKIAQERIEAAQQECAAQLPLEFSEKVV